MSTDEWAVRWTTKAVTFGAVALVLLVAFGIRGCYVTENALEIACRKAGGNHASVGGREGCFKVTAEPVVVP